jgi:hypothetical protein
MRCGTARDARAATAPQSRPLRRIVVAVDPPAAAGIHSCCGIVVAGLRPRAGRVVLADCSVEGASPPGEWANAVAKAYRRFSGRPRRRRDQPGRRHGDGDAAKHRREPAGDDGAGNARKIPARRAGGRPLRAGPGGPCRHVSGAGGSDVRFRPGWIVGWGSPDRLDALVWALTALMLEASSEPRVRGV